MSEHVSAWSDHLLDRLKDLARQMRGEANRPHVPPHENHPFLIDLEALDSRQRRQLACAVSVLWEEFISQIGGPAELAVLSESDHAEYLQSLKRAAQRVRLSGEREKQHYALAPELMARYAEALRRRNSSKEDQTVAATMADLVNRGDLIRKAGRGLRGGNPDSSGGAAA
jgi:hypothetical protein